MLKIIRFIIILETQSYNLSSLFAVFLYVEYDVGKTYFTYIVMQS